VPCSLIEKLTNVSEVFTAFIIIVMSKLLIALMMVTVSTSKTSVNFYETTQHSIPKDVIFMLAIVKI
jgi:uncharacterized integral membrane protein